MEKGWRFVTRSASQRVAGTWVGNWSDDEGNQYLCAFTVTDEGRGRVSGVIEWTLSSTLSDGLFSKVGETGKEFVEGSQLAGSRRVRLRSVKKDDPNRILAASFYELLLSEDGIRLTGRTRTMATSDIGRFFARRTAEAAPETPRKPGDDGVRMDF